jgi:hypothetical protein
MKKIMLLLLFLAACTLPPSPGRAGLLLPPEQMPKWAAQPNNFQLSTDETAIGSKIDVTITADYSWGIAYVLSDYRVWEKIVINPILTKDQIIKQWVKGTAKFTLDITPNKFKPGKTYYIIGYSCNKRLKWECHGNKWMLTSFKVKAPTPPPSPTPSLASETTDVEKEIQELEKELNDLDTEEKLLEELP